MGGKRKRRDGKKKERKRKGDEEGRRGRETRKGDEEGYDGRKPEGTKGSTKGDGGWGERRGKKGRRCTVQYCKEGAGIAELAQSTPRRRVCIGWAGRRRQYCIKTYCRSARRLQSFFYSPLYFKFVPSLRTDASRHLPARTNHSNSNNSFILSSASPGST